MTCPIRYVLTMVPVAYFPPPSCSRSPSYGSPQTPHFPVSVLGLRGRGGEVGQKVGRGVSVGRRKGFRREGGDRGREGTDVKFDMGHTYPIPNCAVMLQFSALTLVHLPLVDFAAAEELVVVVVFWGFKAESPGGSARWRLRQTAVGSAGRRKRRQEQPGSVEEEETDEGGGGGSG